MKTLLIIISIKVMTKPSQIRENLSKYICALMWVQDWGIQDPLKDSPVISNITYPPNVASELPIEQLEISATPFSAGNRRNSVTCSAKFPFRITYVFSRDRFQNFRDIPLAQIENLLFRASTMLLLYAQTIDPDIIEVAIPQQQNPFILRAADDIRSDDAMAADWAITAKVDIDITFICDPSEFVPGDYNQIQPAVFIHPDDLPLPDVDFTPFDLNRVDLAVNRSKLPSVNTADDTSYELDEVIHFDKPTP
jgi:hypothetical protein